MPDKTVTAQEGTRPGHEKHVVDPLRKSGGRQGGSITLISGNQDKDGNKLAARDRKSQGHGKRRQAYTMGSPGAG